MHRASLLQNVINMAFKQSLALRHNLQRTVWQTAFQVNLPLALLKTAGRFYDDRCRVARMALWPAAARRRYGRDIFFQG